MINTVYELITDVMAKQYPDRVAFRYGKDLCPVCAGHPQGRYLF